MQSKRAISGILFIVINENIDLYMKNISVKT